MEPTAVDFWFDPSCPWTWAASRWVSEAAGDAGVPVAWRAFSLAIVNEGVDIPEQYRKPGEAAQRALRVVEAVWASAGPEAVGPLYTELGRRFHYDEEIPPDMEAALRATGLDPALAAAAEEEKWDGEIRDSMAEARALVGEDVGVPILAFTFSDHRQGFSGPIVSPAPTGEDSRALWQAMVTLTCQPGVWEVKRSRTTGPVLPPRP